MSEKKKRNLSERAKSSLETYLSIGSEEERNKVLISPRFLESTKGWLESEYFDFCDEAINRYPHNSQGQNLVMFCQSIMKADYLHLERNIPVRFAEYLIDRLTRLVKWEDEEEPEPDTCDLLPVAKWLYGLLVQHPPSVGKVSTFIRLCGETLDIFWVDNYCRRQISTSVGWERSFRNLLSNGMIDRSPGDEGFWDVWNLACGCYLDQSNPEHYSRERLLMDKLTIMKWRDMIVYPDGLQLAKSCIEELDGIIGRNKTIDLLHLNGWPSKFDPK